MLKFKTKKALRVEVESLNSDVDLLTSNNEKLRKQNTEYETLGIYKTKERALEVLDEIQTILRGKYATSFDYKVSLNGFKKEEVEQMIEQMAVYEMTAE